MRDDSILNTGASSASFAPSKVVTKLRTERQKEKQKQRREFKSVAKLVFGGIRDEMELVMSVTDIDEHTDPQAFMAEVMARKKYVAYLKGLELRLGIIMGSPDDTPRA